MNKQTNTSNNGEQPICFRCKKRIGMLDFAKELIKAEDRRCSDCKIEEFREQGYAKALDDVEKIIEKAELLGGIWINGEELKQEIAKLKEKTNG